MKLIGITGGIGMGKSACARLLTERGVKVIDTDVLAREVVEPGEPALAEIAATFGPEMIGKDGHLRRDELARRVFSNPAERERLEAILHPRIREKWLNQVKELGQQKVSRCAVIIPLLFETHAESEFDVIICVACSATTQRQRLTTRGWSAEQIKQRIAAQWPIEKKINAAHFVIWTESSLEVHAEQLDRILSRI
jgi:dephospho-CoA kinase